MCEQNRLEIPEEEEFLTKICAATTILWSHRASRKYRLAVSAISCSKKANRCEEADSRLYIKQGSLAKISWRRPRIDALPQYERGTEAVADINITSGYWHLAIHPDMQHLYAFLHPMA